MRYAKWWNNIVPHFNEMPTIPVLKKHLVSLFRSEPKSIFDVYDPTGIKHLYQLRLGLSKLRSHKKAHNFLDTSFDACLCKIGVEDTDHFHLICPFYATKRAALASTVMKIIIPKGIGHLGNSRSLYLYGHHTLSNSENADIITATLKFIHESNRFS